MTIGNRLRLWRKENSLNQEEAGAKFGISQDLYQKYESDKSIPGGKILTSVVTAGINVNWLLTGDGDMYLPAEKQKNENYSAHSAQAKNEFALLTYYHVEASAGLGNFIDADVKTSQMAFRKDWLKLKGLQIDACALLTACGDSMEPTISNGDLLLIDTRVDAIKNDAIYVIHIDHALMVKRIQQNLDGSYTIISDNNRYKTQSLSHDMAKDLRIAGRVSWIGHEL